MKTLKKVITLLIAFAMCFNLAACSGGGSETTAAAGGDAQAEADAGASEDSGEKKKILFYTAFIGDFGLSDMGYRTVQELAEEYDMEWTLVEYGAYDAALAVNGFWDALSFGNAQRYTAEEVIARLEGTEAPKSDKVKKTVGKVGACTTYAATGALIGAIGGPVGAAIGAGVGAVVGIIGSICS